MRALEQLVAPRRRLGGDNVRLPHRLTSALQNDFPHVLQWFDDQDPTLCCDFLAPWPPLKAVPLAPRTTLEGFCRAHHVRYADVLDQRLRAIKSATSLTTEDGLIAPNALLVQALVTQRRVTLQAIETVDHAIAQRAQSPPDFPFFAALPGAGAVFAPRLLVAFGEQCPRYPAADELQKDAGMAPVSERRGNNPWVHWRLQCPTFLRHTFVEWAAASTPPSFWARTYDQHQRDKGASHQAAVRALAFTWIRILCRCWQHRTPYDESVSPNALPRRGSPLIHNWARGS